MEEIEYEIEADGIIAGHIYCDSDDCIDSVLDIAQEYLIVNYGDFNSFKVREV